MIWNVSWTPTRFAFSTSVPAQHSALEVDGAVGRVNQVGDGLRARMLCLSYINYEEVFAALATATDGRPFSK